MPPAVLDANLQLACARQDVSASSKLHIPAGVEAYWAPYKTAQSDVWATATSRAVDLSDHTIFTEGGRVIHLASLEVKAAGSSRASPVASTEHNVLSVNNTQGVDAVDAVSSTEQAGAGAVDAFQFPHMYQLKWKPLLASGSEPGAGHEHASPAIHWKRFDAYDASGRRALKDVYHMASGGRAALGFEVDVESIVTRAKMSSRQLLHPADTDEEEDTNILAAATSELLTILREAAADASVSQARGLSLSRSNRPTCVPTSRVLASV
jgi:hypothetical protein